MADNKLSTTQRVELTVGIFEAYKNGVHMIYLFPAEVVPWLQFAALQNRATILVPVDTMVTTSFIVHSMLEAGQS